jgi:hypothetical protein
VTADQIVFTPLLSPLWLGILAAAALLIILPALIRNARGAGLRALAFLFLFAILTGPNWLAETRRALPDIALLLVDHSQSMDIGDRRALAAKAAATIAGSANGIDLRTLDIPPAEDGGTTLFSALHSALTGIPENQLAGIIAITDGEISDAPAAPLHAPFTALLSALGEETDRELRIIDAPAYGLVGQTVALKFVILDHGAKDDGAPAKVTITEDGTTIASPLAVIGQPVTLNLPVRHAGPTIIEAAVAALPGEASPINDQAAFTLNGIHRRLNVLLISGSPDPGERTWRLLLKSDPAIQLVHFTILRTPGETIDADPRDLALVPFPVHQLFETDIAKFDLIILDRFDTAGLLPAEYLSNIADYVRNGGALLAEVGPEFSGPDSLAFTPLGSVLPAQPADPGALIQKFAPTVTPLGSRHPVTAPFAGAAMAPWYRMEVAVPTAGDVLMTGANNAPLLVLGDAGHGRVGMLLSDQFWLWTRGGGHDGPALPLLRRIVHFLLREPALEPELLSVRIDGQKLIIGRQTLSPDYPGDAAIIAPNGQSQKIALRLSASGQYTASVPIGQSGVWKITEGGQTAYAATAIDNAVEYQDLAATAKILAPIARNIVWLGKSPAPPLAELLQPRHATQVTGTSEVPLLPPLPTVFAALALIAAAWWRESR